MIAVVLAKDPKVDGFSGSRQSGAHALETGSIIPKLRMIVGVKIVTARFATDFIPSVREKSHVMRCEALRTAPAQRNVGCT